MKRGYINIQGKILTIFELFLDVSIFKKLDILEFNKYIFIELGKKLIKCNGFTCNFVFQTQNV